MKLYAYVSESEKLSDLVSITESTKAYNNANGITGIFSYNQGYYLQVIEGEEEAVEASVKKLWVDTRHQNICEILDVEIDEQFFSDWSLNLFPLLKRNESFLSFVDTLNKNIHLLSHNQRYLMKLFCAINDKKTSIKQETNSLKPLKYSINEWPNGDVINASSRLLSLCGTLMNNPTNFRMLIENERHGRKEEVRSMLNQLNKAGFLTVTQSAKNKSDLHHRQDLYKVQKEVFLRDSRSA